MHPENLSSYSSHTEEQDNADFLLDRMNSWNIPRKPEFDDKLPDLLGELTDLGVHVEDIVGYSRRVVFSGTYKSKQVAIKLSLDSFPDDQQQKEELIWNSAVTEGDERFFAKIHLCSPSSAYVVQEFCKDIRQIDDPVKLERYGENFSDIAEKYDLHEYQIGINSQNNLVFVDYGF